jgi:hypothetical protein
VYGGRWEAVDAYLRSLTPDERRSDTVHADYETHRGVRWTHRDLPTYVRLKCYNIFQDLDRVLVGRSSFGPSTPSDTQPRDLLAFEWVNRD